MLIDWFTIGAQVLNFLVLLWLMKRFLYKPVLRAIAAREKLVADQLADAEARKSEAEKEHGEFRQRNHDIDQQRDTLIREAQEEAQAELQRLLTEARDEASRLSLKRREAVRAEERNLRQAISHRAQEEVFAITRKALADLGGTSLEERLGEVFRRRLQRLDEEAKATLAEALKRAPDPARVRSAFELPAEQRTTIQKALNETFATEVPIQFETAPELIGGIELTANGQKLAWSISDYLTSLEEGVAELLKGKKTSEAGTGSP